MQRHDLSSRCSKLPGASLTLNLSGADHSVLLFPVHQSQNIPRLTPDTLPYYPEFVRSEFRNSPAVTRAFLFPSLPLPASSLSNAKLSCTIGSCMAKLGPGRY